MMMPIRMMMMMMMIIMGHECILGDHLGSTSRRRVRERKEY
jgi:hypothetical protein